MVIALSSVTCASWSVAWAACVSEDPALAAGADSLASLTIEDDFPFILVGINALQDWNRDIMKHTADGVRCCTVRLYNLSYYLENDAFCDAYIAFGNW